MGLRHPIFRDSGFPSACGMLFPIVMGHPPFVQTNGTSTEALTASQSEVVHLELGRVLESPGFRASKRCQKFLRFAVETTLAGNGEILKESTVAIQVFARPAAIDAS